MQVKKTHTRGIGTQGTPKQQMKLSSGYTQQKCVNPFDSVN